jgi:hypothetical protein
MAFRMTRLSIMSLIITTLIMVPFSLLSSGSTEVKHSPHHLKVKGSFIITAADTGRDIMTKIFKLKHLITKGIKAYE